MVCSDIGASRPARSAGAVPTELTPRAGRSPARRVDVGGEEQVDMAQEMAERTINRATPPRTPEQIEAELERTRAELARTVDEIAERVALRNVARRAVGKVRAQFVDDEGRVRVGRAGALAASLVAVVALAVWRRRG
jgi:hypothetical protein